MPHIAVISLQYLMNLVKTIGFGKNSTCRNGQLLPSSHGCIGGQLLKFSIHFSDSLRQTGTHVPYKTDKESNVEPMPKDITG